MLQRLEVRNEKEARACTNTQIVGKSVYSLIKQQPDNSTKRDEATAGRHVVCGWSILYRNECSER